MSQEIVKKPGKKNSIPGPVRDNGSCIHLSIEKLLERQKERDLVKVPTPDLCPKL